MMWKLTVFYPLLLKVVFYPVQNFIDREGDYKMEVERDRVSEKNIKGPVNLG